MWTDDPAGAASAAMDVACTIAIWRHPEKHVEDLVPFLDKGMWMRHIDRLLGQHMNTLPVWWRRNSIVRQVWVKIKGWNLFQPTSQIQIPAPH